jgi:hypothetical protein
VPQDIPDLDVFIRRDQRALRVYVGFGAFIVLLGVLLVVASFFPVLGAAGGAALLLKLGGGFIATLASFPLKEYLARRDRIDAVRGLKEIWLKLSRSANPPQDEVERVRDLTWKMLEKATAG